MSVNPGDTVYIIKYALTKGIFSAVVKRYRAEDSFVSVCDNNGLNKESYYYAKEWAKDKDDAIAMAERMKTAKIKNLQKQIQKLESTTFEVVE